MTKIIKIVAHFLLSSLEIVFFCIVALLFLIRSVEFQNFLGKHATRYASECLGANITIDRVEILFFDRVSLKGVVIDDPAEQPILNLGELYVNFDLISLIQILNEEEDRIQIHVDEVGIIATSFTLEKSLETEQLNIQFLIDAFSSDKPKSEVNFSIRVDDFFIEDTHFSYANHTEGLKDFGIDFNHLLASNIDLVAKDVLITESYYKAAIQHLSLNEKSGFDLHHLASKAYFDAFGLQLNDLFINTPSTDLALPVFEMNTQNYSSYGNFIEEVELIASMDSSCISMTDVSIFVPALRGMDQDINLKVNVSEYISNLNLNDLYLSFGDASYITGNFILPDFSNLDEAQWNQQIEKLYLKSADLASFKLPSDTSSQYLTLPKEVLRAGFIESSSVKVNGATNDLIVSLPYLTTQQGVIKFNSPLAVQNSVSSVPMKVLSSSNRQQFINFNHYDLGGLLAVDELGKINGGLGFVLTVGNEEITIDKTEAYFSKLSLLDMDFHHVSLTDLAVLVDLRKSSPVTSISGGVFVRDEFLDLSYQGKTVISDVITTNANMGVECLDLGKFVKEYPNEAELITDFHIEGTYKSLEDLKVDALVENLYFEQEERHFTVNQFNLKAIRNNGDDELMIASDVLDANIKGYADVNKFIDNLIYQFSRVFPVFLPELVAVEDTVSKFDYRFDIHDINPILEVLYPQIEIADHTLIDGEYNGKENFFNLTVVCDSFRYDKTRVYAINLMQNLYRGQLSAVYDTGPIYLKENKLIKNTHFTTLAGNSFMDSHLILHDKNNSRSNIGWHTLIFDTDGFDIDILPSYFTVNKHKWTLNDLAHINFSHDCFFIEDFNLFRDDQRISINGQLSKNPADILGLEVVNVDLSDFTLLISTEQDYAGTLDLKGAISEPLTELKFSGQASVNDLIIDDRLVGDLSFSAAYDIVKNGIAMSGDLMVMDTKTFSFEGDYWLSQPDSCLDFKLDFRNTDISVVNAYLDPNVVSGIRGDLKGYFNLTGSFKEPVVDGKIDLNNGAFVLALLGARFNYEGEVLSSEHGILVNNMPITDEEGNTGFLHGFLFHNYFKDFIFEIVFNFEDHPTKRNPLNRSEPLKLDKFLVMKTRYTEESIYYGNAYMTGTAVVAGTTDNLDVTVNAKTRRGTWINFPMYGPKTFEEEGFIRFKSNEEEEEEERKIDFTGVNLSLNFEITPAAQVKLIFDEQIGDEITAQGNADLRINLDSYGDIALNGVYTATEGVYNFALGPYRQNFFIAEGGTVRWTGNPYSAQLDIRAYYRTIANLNVVMPDVVETRTTDNDEIFSYINLRGDMMRPEISFDIDAPRSGESGRTIINRIRADQDELNRQFFALLIQKRFLPLTGMENTAAGRGNAFLDMASNQINSVLDMVSTDYKLNVNLEADNITGEEVYEFGVAKGFLDDRLVVRGSFGMGRQTAGGNDVNQALIDVHVEYLLNERGTFRVNVFNESNTNRAILDMNRGLYTQGVGVNYKEEFQNVQDFNLLQSTLNVFRKDKRVIERDYSRYIEIPSSYLNKEATKEDEESIKIEKE